MRQAELLGSILWKWENDGEFKLASLLSTGKSSIAAKFSSHKLPGWWKLKAGVPPLFVFGDETAPSSTFSLSASWELSWGLK